MAYNTKLAERVRSYLTANTTKPIREQKMFGGLAFLVNEKMCVNVSGELLMCRIAPAELQGLKKRSGYNPMLMRGKELSGYCLIAEEGYQSNTDLAFWLQQCLAYNDEAKPARQS